MSQVQAVLLLEAVLKNRLFAQSTGVSVLKARAYL
jgi:hypothetical protein